MKPASSLPRATFWERLQKEAWLLPKSCLSRSRCPALRLMSCIFTQVWCLFNTWVGQRHICSQYPVGSLAATHSCVLSLLALFSLTLPIYWNFFFILACTLFDLFAYLDCFLRIWPSPASPPHKLFVHCYFVTNNLNCTSSTSCFQYPVCTSVTITTEEHKNCKWNIF